MIYPKTKKPKHQLLPKISQWGKAIALYLLLAGIALLMLFPLFWLLTTAFKSPTENIFQFPPQFLPEKPTLVENFIQLSVAKSRYIF